MQTQRSRFGGWWIAVAAAGLMLVAAPARAAGVFFAGHLADGQYVHDRAEGAPCYSVRYCTVTAALDGENARTTVEETFAGAEAGAAVGLIPLPEGADEAALLGRFPGARILSPEEALKLMTEVARASHRPAVLALGNRRSLLIPEVKTDPKTPFTIEFAHKVRNAAGLMTYACPMPVPALASAPVEKLTVTATVKNGRALRGVFSPSHPARVDRRGPREAVVTVAEERTAGSGDFTLFYAADDDPIGLRVLTYRSPADDDGYFLVFGCPSGNIKAEPPPAKDIVFVLDTSGSMRGEKIEQARAAVEYCLKHLNPGDRFNIVTFGTEVRTFRERLVKATAALSREAAEFMEDTVASGRTNIGEALARALADAADPSRMRIMIFLTDGTPTAGELVPDRILEKVTEWNKGKTRVFVVGVGTDVNAHLLDRLAEATDGGSEYVAPDEEIDVKLAALYNRLSHPVLSNAELAFGGLTTTSVFPKKIPALFEGSDVMVAGRYKGGGRHTLTLTGSLAGQTKEYQCAADFPDKPAEGTDTGFVASLWAARSVGFLLQEIRLHGPNKELIEEVVRLSKQFGIVTEYTLFLAEASGDLSKEEAMARAEGNMAAANDRKSGQWAVAQAVNDRELQTRVVAAPQMNAYRDQRGEKRMAENVRQVGNRAFYLRNNQWEEADAAGAREVRKVKMFSDEYFALVKSDEGFRKAQEIGAAMSINVGRERIVVEK